MPIESRVRLFGIQILPTEELDPGTDLHYKGGILKILTDFRLVQIPNAPKNPNNAQPEDKVAKFLEFRQIDLALPTNVPGLKNQILWRNPPKP